MEDTREAEQILEECGADETLERKFFVRNGTILQSSGTYIFVGNPHPEDPVNWCNVGFLYRLNLSYLLAGLSYSEVLRIEPRTYAEIVGAFKNKNYWNLKKKDLPFYQGLIEGREELFESCRKRLESIGITPQTKLTSFNP